MLESGRSSTGSQVARRPVRRTFWSTWMNGAPEQIRTSPDTSSGAQGSPLHQPRDKGPKSGKSCFARERTEELRLAQSSSSRLPAPVRHRSHHLLRLRRPHHRVEQLPDKANSVDLVVVAAGGEA